MRDATFSELLKGERLRRGLTLEQASAATRVRKQILVAFEEGDYTSMPPRGYAKNMIASYARWLGLSPQAVVETYLDDLNAYESDRTFDDDPYRFYGSRTEVGQSQGKGRPERYRRDTRGGRDNNTSMRRYDTHGANDTKDRDYSRSYRNASVGNIGSRNGHSNKSSRIFSDRKSYRNGGGDNRMKVIVVIIVAVLIVALVSVLANYVTSCSKKEQSVDQPTANTTKTEETSTSTTQSGTTSTTTTSTTPFTATFSVADGQTCTVVATVDGLEAYNATVVDDSSSHTFEVSNTATFTFSNPSAVTLTRNGEAEAITVAEDGSGSATLSVDGTNAATTTTS